MGENPLESRPVPVPHFRVNGDSARSGRILPSATPWSDRISADRTREGSLMVFRLPPREEGRRPRRKFPVSGVTEPGRNGPGAPAAPLHGARCHDLGHDGRLARRDHRLQRGHSPHHGAPLSFCSLSFRQQLLRLEPAPSRWARRRSRPARRRRSTTAASPPAASAITSSRSPLPAGLTINPMHPYVLAVADPATAQAASTPLMTSSFHIDTIAVVTHGGLQDHAYNRTGPPWELKMAASLAPAGFQHRDPVQLGDREQHPRARRVLQAPGWCSRCWPARRSSPRNDVVDLQFIGHSKERIVNAQAIQQLETRDHAADQGRLDRRDDARSPRRQPRHVGRAIQRR